MTALDALDAACDTLAGLPVNRMTRHELEAVLHRLDALRTQVDNIDRRLVGRLISEGPPNRFGSASWAEVLARRLRISQAEAQRRVTAAMHAA